ncbi:hypothetical protein LWI28_029225 [Acer negundo]|uniref:Uncharacterized protein n=1 Tax=Acer negundo TaxID=4023 RepID=A0AAD5JKP6_ACENE|nr:hypothetical protein LWI28_029225 [Acer negundo]
MDKILTVSVLYVIEVLELGECDVDHISLINLVHAMTKEFSGRFELSTGGFTISAELPWSNDTTVIKTTHCPPSNTPHSPIDEPEVVEQIGWCNEEDAMFDCEADGEGGDTESDEGVESDGEGVQTGERVDSNGCNNGERVGLDDGVGDKVLDLDDSVKDEGVQNEHGVGIDGGSIVGDDEITKQCMTLFDGYESRSDDD